MPEITNAAEALVQDEQLEIYDWLSSLGSQGDIEVTLKRNFPPSFQGVQVKGTLAKFDEPVDEEYIQSTYGGGKFQVVVKTRDDKGRWKYAGARTFDIAGNPKIDALVGATPERDAPQQPRESDNVLRHAMDMATSMAEKAEQRAARAEQSRNSGTDWSAFDRILTPLQNQVNELSKLIAEKDARIVELVSKPTDRSGEDRLLNVLEGKESSYANQLATIRTAHDSELRQLREFHREELRDRERRFEKEIDGIRKAADREIDSIKMAHSQALESQRQGYEMRIETLKESNQRTERELDLVKKELIELRAKKELSPTQQLEQLVQLKGGFDAVFSPPGGDDDDKKSGLERALDTVLNSPVAEGIASRIAAAGMGAPGGQPQMPDMVTIRTPDGRTAVVPRHMAEEIARRQQAAEAGEGAPEPAVKLDQADVDRAVAFIEGAIRNNTDPAIFAASARNMIPSGILAVVKQQGVDHFLNNVAKIQDGSPLASVAGRNWVRKVAKFLLEGTTDTGDDLDDDDQPLQ